MPAKSRRATRRASATYSKSSLEGFAELRRMLVEELPRATQRNTLKKVARESLKPTYDQVKQSAPVLSGRLQNSVRLDVGFDDPGYRARARAAFRAKGHARGVKKTKGGGNIVSAIKVGGPDAPHAPFVEFGTVKMAADPFLRPAFDADSDGMIDRIRETFSVEVRKAVGRRRKKLGITG